MKDKSDTIRGACQQCPCSEYILDNKNNKCSQCSCAASKHRQEDYGSKKSLATLDAEKSEAVIWRATASTIVWLAATFFIGFYAIQDRASLLTFDRGVSDFAYLLGIANIGLAFLFCYSFTNAKEIERSTIANLLAQILGVATVTFGLFYFRGTLQLKDANGYPVDVARYLEWIRSCPATAAVIGYATNGNPTLAKRAEISSFISLVFGFAGAILKEPWAEICLIFAICTHYTALYDFYDMFENAITGRSNSKFDPDSLSAARMATLISFNGFPLAFFLVRFGWVSYEVGEVLLIATELLSKSILAVFLLTSNIEEKPIKAPISSLELEETHIKAA